MQDTPMYRSLRDQRMAFLCDNFAKVIDLVLTSDDQIVSAMAFVVAAELFDMAQRKRKGGE